MAARKLRVASAADAPKPKPKTLSQAIEGGSYLEILEAQRRQMIADLPDVNGPAKAALHRQIALHSKEIAALQAAADQEKRESVAVPDEDFDASAI